jgi:hypothetical protein
VVCRPNLLNLVGVTGRSKKADVNAHSEAQISQLFHSVVNSSHSLLNALFD